MRCALSTHLGITVPVRVNDRARHFDSDERVPVECNHPPTAADLGSDHIGECAARVARRAARRRREIATPSVARLITTRGVLPLRDAPLCNVHRHLRRLHLTPLLLRHPHVLALDGNVEWHGAHQVEVAVVGLGADVVHALDIGKDGKERRGAVCRDQVEGRREHAAGGASKGGAAHCYGSLGGGRVWRGWSCDYRM